MLPGSNSKAEQSRGGHGYERCRRGAHPELLAQVVALVLDQLQRRRELRHLGLQKLLVLHQFVPISACGGDHGLHACTSTSSSQCQHVAVTTAYMPVVASQRVIWIDKVSSSKPTSTVLSVWQ